MSTVSMMSTSWYFGICWEDGGSNRILRSNNNQLPHPGSWLLLVIIGKTKYSALSEQILHRMEISWKQRKSNTTTRMIITYVEGMGVVIGCYVA